EILSHCSLREIGIVSDFPTAGPIARMELKERVARVLRKKGLDPDETLSRMRESNVVMEGQGILQVLLPECEVGDEISFCCPGWGREPFCQYLRTAGYEVEDEDDQTAEVPDDGLHNLYTGCRCVRLLRNENGSTIAVDESVSMSPLVPIFFGVTTVSMNYVSAEGVACFYPDLTLKKSGRRS
ncbi:hypothetical protein DFP72DRAFT_819146, partial [Ephemerocybe angulata]